MIIINNDILSEEQENNDNIYLITQYFIHSNKKIQLEIEIIHKKRKY